MQLKTSTLIVGAAVTALVLYLALSRNRQPSEAADLGRLLPELSAAEPRLATFEVQRGGRTVHLDRQDDGFAVRELGGYPARFEAVATLFRGLADLQQVESKTSRPERHGELGLADPGAEGSDAALVRALDANGAELGAVVVGKRFHDLPGEHFFARLPDQDQTWLVRGNFQAESDPLQWVERQAVALPSDATAKVRGFDAAGAPTFVVSRPTGADYTFELEGLPAGLRSKGPGLPGRLGRLLNGLRFERVAPRAEQTLPEAPAHRLVYETFDGLEVTVEAYPTAGTSLAAEGVPDDALWVTLSARTVDPAEPVESMEGEAGAAGEEATETETDDGARLARLAEQRDRIAATSGWLYQLSSYDAEPLRADLDTLAEPIPEPVAPPEPTLGPPSPTEGSEPFDGRGEGPGDFTDVTESDPAEQSVPPEPVPPEVEPAPTPEEPAEPPAESSTGG
jgi:hypothetical protein